MKVDQGSEGRLRREGSALVQGRAVTEVWFIEGTVVKEVCCIEGRAVGEV